MYSKEMLFEQSLKWHLRVMQIEFPQQSHFNLQRRI